MAKKENRIVASNKRISYDYEILNFYVAGIVLLGSEVKKVRAGKVSIADSFCFIKNGEVFVKNFIIEETESAFSHEKNRIKKLLLNKSEINYLEKNLKKGITIVVQNVREDDNFLKMQIALVKGKKNYDKRESIKEKEIKLELKRKEQ